MVWGQELGASSEERRSRDELRRAQSEEPGARARGEEPRAKGEEPSFRAASERAAWPLLPSGEFTLFVRHTDKAIVVEPYRVGRLRFRLVPNDKITS